MDSHSRTFSCSGLVQNMYCCGELQNIESLSPEDLSDDKIDLLFNRIIFNQFEEIQTFCSKDQLFPFLSSNIQNQDMMNIVLSLNRSVSPNFSIKPTRSSSFKKKDLNIYALALHLFVSWKGTDMSSDEIYREIKSTFLDYFHDFANYTEGRVISYYILTSLKFLTLFWGICYRNLAVSDQEISRFKVGSLICFRELWVASKNKKNSEGFRGRMIISSLSSRNIHDLLGNEFENDVVFPPFCHFFVVKKEKIDDSVLVYLKEMPLGVENKTVLWVDQNALDPTYENKRIIDDVLFNNQMIQFVLRDSTEKAIEYLKSTIGIEKIRAGSNGFRIITNMTRANEVEPYEAGARFIKAAIQLGCKGNMMVYTGNVLNSRNSLRNLNISEDEVRINTDPDIAKSFASFENLRTTD
jgi:hypothetical protein